MADFVNTRASIGDQETVDGLVEHSLTELKEDGIGTIETYALYKNTGLETVELPGIATIKSNAFDGCTKLGVATLGKEDSASVINIQSSAFANCSALKHFRVRNNAKATLANVNAFSGTPIGTGDGAIYVPSAKLSEYKADSVWKNLFVVDDSKYPLSKFVTIEDSWAEIDANDNWDTDYQIGDTAIFNDGTYDIVMQLVGKNKDTLSSDNESKARMTWLSKKIYYRRQMNTTNSTAGGYGEMSIKTWLEGEYWAKIPEELRNVIKAVNKTWRSKSPNDETLSGSLKIWLPSYKEVGFTNATYVESNGVVYSDVFNSNAARIKYDTSGSANSWWLRSAYSATDFRCVNSSGGEVNGNASYTVGVVFGFCI